MASTGMHLYVGYLLARETGGIASPPQFYLGCVAPDCVNMDGFAKKETRWAAHLRSADLSRWYSNIGRFYAGQLRPGADDSLLLGYAVHCITDVAWDEHFHGRVWDGMEKLALPQMIERLDRGWDDCFRFDHDQFTEDWWTDTVRPALEAAVPGPLPGIPADLLERYRQYVLYRYPSTIPEGGPHMVSRELVGELAGIVRERCERLIPGKRI